MGGSEKMNRLQTTRGYVPGGHNVRSECYDNGGFLPFAPKARFLGTPGGNWYEIGVHIGSECKEMIAASTDYWWIQMCRKKGKPATQQAMRRYLSQIEALDPTQIELLHGIAEGASAALEAAQCGNPGSPFCASAFDRVVAAGIFDVWLWGDPDAYRRETRAGRPAEGYINGNGCNSIAAKGSATRNGETISSQVRHTQQAGLCYQASAVYRAEGNHAVWTVGNTPSICGLLLLNDCGVSISHHYGGSTTAASLSAAGDGGYGSAYGVPWPNLLFYAAKAASCAEEALDILAHGNERYRARTGRRTVLRDGVWNWMVCDPDTLSVMEASPDRYAIRYAGEFTGDAWSDPDYIACANHFLCPYSYDRNDVRTDVPMTVFNSISNSQARFWTLMWELKSWKGKLDVPAVQYIFSQTYLRDEATGDFIYTMPDGRGGVLPSGIAFGCAQGKLIDNGLVCGTNAAKIATLNRENSAAWFCLGNPKDWIGEWDQYGF